MEIGFVPKRDNAVVFWDMFVPVVKSACEGRKKQIMVEVTEEGFINNWKEGCVHEYYAFSAAHGALFCPKCGKQIVIEKDC